eukprot:IDg10385t1
MHFEKTFKVLVQQWGIFWLLLAFSISNSLLIFTAIIRLHNHTIYEDDLPAFNDCESPHEREISAKKICAWWVNATAIRGQEYLNGHRRDLDVCVLLEKLTTSLDNL